MTHIVYGFRLIDDREIRYIGQTMFDGPHRLAYEFQLAKMRSRHSGPRDPIAAWLLGNEGRIEAVTLVRCADVIDARQQEKRLIGACLAMGHRLFNRQHVPAPQRVVAIEVGHPASPQTVRSRANPHHCAFGAKPLEWVA